MKNNPYIGPRPYQRGEGNFFGREREGKELAWLILAEQAVLFYAQSGAGKTSLLNARVIPILEKKGVLVLPVARVGSSLPASIEPGQIENIFVFSALLGLTADKDISPQALVGHSLRSYLQEYGLRLTTNDGRPTTTDQRPTLLILDQFEEIATTHRDRWEEAESFFRQVREAIDTLPGLGVLFVLREDYVAELDPYTPLLPSHLQARFRMTLPTRQQAVQIVMGPAEQAGCPFDEEAARNLVANLGRIKGRQIEKADRDREGDRDNGPRSAAERDREPVLGQYVEPVQLQVVCQQLWESLPEAAGEDKLITWDEIKGYNVDQALTNFYENTLASVIQTSGMGERRLRQWFRDQLITPEGRRGLALQGQTETAGLPNAAVTALENHHLIRSEVRAGSRWYELSHDRLVEPIVQSNAAWEAARQTPLRTAAKRWQESGSQDLLYRGKALREAWAWLQANPDEAEPYERDFIQAAQQAEQARTRTRAWRVVTFAALAILVLVLSVQPVQRLWLRWRAQALGELVWIDSSQTILGDDDLFPTNKALPYGVYTVTAFAIEKYEVTNERYLLCVEANSCSPPNAPPSEYAATERSRYPVTSVTAQQADQFCTWIGRRLPTEAEWERAARSAEGAPWPWGQADPVTFTQVYLSYGDPRNVSVQESGQATQDRSLEGVYDLAGNAWEWTCTPYTETVYDPSDCADLNKYFPDRLVAKGGDAGGSLDAIHHTMAHHYSSRPWRPDSFGGFRCATSLER